MEECRRELSAANRMIYDDQAVTISFVMWNHFGIPGHSIENSGVGVLIASALICLVIALAGMLYFLVE